ncbi:hypothetical protein N7467_004699 [Penicillium canescens]|nr:hypothetical protein N7467_004699 [Penicillium canescens]
MIETTAAGSRTVDWQAQEKLDDFNERQIAREDALLQTLNSSQSEPELRLPPFLPREPPSIYAMPIQPGSGIWDDDEHFQSSPLTVLPVAPVYQQRQIRTLEHISHMAQDMNAWDGIPALQDNDHADADGKYHHNGYHNTDANTDANDEGSPYQIIQTYLSSLTPPYKEISQTLQSKKWPLKTIYALLTVLEQSHIHLLFTLRRKGRTESEIKEIEKLCRAHVTGFENLAMPDEALGIEDMSVSQWLGVEMARRRKIGFQFGVSGSGTGG